MPPKHVSAMHEESDDDNEHEDTLHLHMEKFFNPYYSVKFMNALPRRIRERSQVLMHYHEKYEALRKEFEEKETALRRKYDEIYFPIYERRKEIVTGTGKPVTDDEVAKGFPEEHKDTINTTPLETETEPVEEGLPNFWLDVLRHHVLPQSMIEDYDEEVLSYLSDIRSGVIDGGYGSIAVAFTFKPNPFIEEETLVISLIQKEESTQIVRSPLTWKKGKNITQTTVTKKIPAKRGAPARKKTMTVSRPSFFAIFKETKAPNAEDDAAVHDDDSDNDVDDDQVEQLLEVLHTAVIPNAIQCFTGEAPDGSSDVESAGSTDDDDDDEEEEEEEEEPVMPHRGRGGRAGGAAKGGRGGGGGGGSAGECKQQ